LAESRERNGVATRYETASARAQLATINATVPELTQRRNQLMNALALLLGAEPRALDAQLRQAIPLPSLPTEVPVGVSSELAHRRPDILRAAQLSRPVLVWQRPFYPALVKGG
jgi:outer membrane protein TolC